MPIADDLASNSLLISSGVAMIAVFLGLRQWYEWRARETELSDLDHRYFARQDVRRGLGVAVMLIIAMGLYFGSRMPPKVAGHANLTFVLVWLAIIGLIIVMLLLAFLDWLSTRLYARRHSRSMARQRLQLLRETLRKTRGDRAADQESRPD
jgi:magnesium-transporting ATPase (P-type)